MDGSISFNSNSLQTFSRTTRTGIIVDHIDLESAPERKFDMFALAHANESVIPSDEYPSKMIPITGTIVSDTANNLSTLLDTFRGYLTGRSKNLDVGYGGVVRRYIATALSPVITRSEDKKYATFTLSFACTVPFGVETSNTTALNGTGRTANSYTDSHTFLGSAPVQLPVITITLTAVSSTGSQQMFFGNNDTGQAITIARSNWTAGDVVVINCATRSVQVNGIETDFTGAFPEFTTGVHAMLYIDTFTSRTMTENVVYAKRYL